MYDMAEEGAKNADANASEQPQSKKNQSSGTVTKENWNSWKRRFREVVDDETLTDGSRIAAATASDTMERIERKATGRRGIRGEVSKRANRRAKVLT